MFLRNAASYLLGSIAGLMGRDVLMPVTVPLPQANILPRKGKKKKARAENRRVLARSRTKRYPHSSKRQQARYARQISNGQLNFMPIHGVPDRRAA